MRIWRRGGAEAPQWAIRMTHAQEGLRRLFANPEAFVSYLHSVLRSGDPAPRPASRAGAAGE